MFGISISGIKNSQHHINVTSNNIANSNTYGFKKSRAEFADVYANSVFSNNRTNAGMGVSNTVVSQQFAQGNLSGDTGNSLDCAIQGNGFFVVSSGNGANDLSFTRNGAFQVDKNGFLVTATGQYVQGWDVNADGSSTSLDLNNTSNIQLPSDAGAPNPSHNIGIGVNLPADKDPVKVPTVAKPDGSGNYTEEEIRNGIEHQLNGSSYKQYYSSFDPKDPSTYTCSTSQTIHDSLGRSHTLTYYMIKVGADGENSTNTVWNVVPFLDGKPVDIAQQGNENPVQITVADSKSSVNGANFFGFQIKFDGNGEMIKGSQIPSTLELVNPVAGESSATGAIGNSLRHEIFGGPLEDDNGDKNRIDPTFEGDKPIYASGNGSLSSCLGEGVDRNQVVNIQFDATQYGSSKFTVTDAPWNDGYSTGILLGVTIDKEGVITAEFSNGQTKQVAKLAMADFTNVQGLTKVGDTMWKQSNLSGDAIAREANQGSAGSIISNNLEMSNVDLTNELVELIVAQRNYQANSQSLQTQNTVLDSILNIR